jgi:hypothetical protein
MYCSGVPADRGNVGLENVEGTGYQEELSVLHTPIDGDVFFLKNLCLAVAVVYKAGHINSYIVGLSYR